MALVLDIGWTSDGYLRTIYGTVGVTGDKQVTVRFYRLPCGREPVRDWLLSLEREERLVIGSDIKTVAFGWPVGLPVCRSMGDGL